MKKIIKYVFILLIFFGFKINVNAFQSVDRVSAIEGEMCPNGSCIKICEYDDSVDFYKINYLVDSQFIKMYEDSNINLFTNFSFVGYYYNTNKGVPSKLFPSTKGWLLSFPLLEASAGKVFGEGLTGYFDNQRGGLVLYSVWNDLPTDDIYSFENVKSIEELNIATQKKWKDEALYRNLSNKLECPKKMSYNSKGIGFYNFGLDGGINLVYSFKDEVEQVLPKAMSDLSWRFFIGPKTSEFENNKRIEFISNIENDVLKEYSASNNGEKLDFQMQNGTPSNSALTKYCPYFKSVIEKDKGVEYSGKIYDRYKDTYKTNIDINLKKYADGSTRDSAVYTYDNLHTVLTYKDNEVLRYRIDLFENFENLLVEDISDSLDYLSASCSSAGITIDYDKSATASSLKKSHSLYTYTDPVIDFKDEYNCSILSDFADIISTGYFIIEMLGLAILIVLSSMDYLKIFLNDNSDELKKANSNLAKRLGIVVALFLLPAFINVLFNIFHIEGVNSEHPLCVQISNK